MKPFLAAIFALPLAACGQPESANDAAANAAPAAGNGTNYVAEVKAMPEPVRRATFLRAIRDAGQACQNVVADQPAEAVDGNPAWGTRCEDGLCCLISIAPDGNAKVTGPVAAK